MNMDHIRPMKKGEDLVEYCRSIASEMFEGVMRDSGLPYTQEHLGRIAVSTRKLILPTYLQEIAESAAWIHDAPEDIKGVDVFDPLNRPKFIRKEGVTYLNDLLKEADKKGEYVCHVVDLMTHRKDISYKDYAYNIYSIPLSGESIPPRITAEVLKTDDRRFNTSPDDRRNVDKLVDEYLASKDADIETLKKFYKKTKTIDAFTENWDYRFNLGLFVEAVNNAFKEKQLAFATDNLALYLPLAERKLLIGVGKNNDIFDWNGLRQLMKDAYIDSLRISIPYGLDEHFFKMIGENKKVPEVEGYTRLLKEVRNERLEGKIQSLKFFVFHPTID